MKQEHFRRLALKGPVRPGWELPTAVRVRLDDGDPTREAAFKLCQDSLDAWSAVPDDADPQVTAAARDALRDALGMLGAVTRRSLEPSPYVGRRAIVDHNASVAALLK